METRIKVKKPIALGLSLVLGISIIIFVTMLLFNVTDYGITIASFGATIFMILSSGNINKKKVFGAYIAATIIGYAFSKFSISHLNVALAALMSIVIMTLLEFQHAPAIGMSIAMVLNKFSFWTDFIVLFCIFFILGITLMLKAFLLNPDRIMNFIEIEEEKIKWNIREKEIPDYLKLY